MKDLLLSSTIPGYTGYTHLMENVGQTSNRGVELSLTGYIIDRPDFTLNATFNIGRNKNKIDKLRGMNISITTTAKTDEEAKALLAAFHFPFRN